MERRGFDLCASLFRPGPKDLEVGNMTLSSAILNASPAPFEDLTQQEEALNYYIALPFLCMTGRTRKLPPVWAKTHRD